jgi:hypothetical protein
MCYETFNQIWLTTREGVYSGQRRGKSLIKQALRQEGTL